jgi:hypothetical protein
MGQCAVLDAIGNALDLLDGPQLLGLGGKEKQYGKDGDNGLAKHHVFWLLTDHR